MTTPNPSQEEPVWMCSSCTAGPPHTCTMINTTCRDVRTAWHEGWDKGIAFAIRLLEQIARDRFDGRTYTPIGVGANELRKKMGWGHDDR